MIKYASGEWVNVCSIDEIGDGEVFQFEIAGLPNIAVYFISGRHFATDDMCSHGEASLADGDLEEFIIECPWHAGKFDIRTGEAVASPCMLPIRTYETRTNEGMVQIWADRSKSKEV